MEHKVILINRMLGYGAVNTVLRGHSGKAYGQPSRYSLDYKCHIVELNADDYEAGREDIFKKMRHAASGFLIWEPQFVSGSEKSESAASDDLDVPFFTLRKIAKEHGLDPSDPALKGVENLKKAIRIARSGNELQQKEMAA